MKLHEELSFMAIEECIIEVDDDSKLWDFILASFDTTSLKIRGNPHPGIYECQFDPQLVVFKILGYPYTIFLINAGQALDEQYKLSKELSSFDKEWLILPAMPRAFGNRVEFSAILDASNISVEKYKINRFNWEKYNTITY